MMEVRRKLRQGREQVASFIWTTAVRSITHTLLPWPGERHTHTHTQQDTKFLRTCVFKHTFVTTLKSLGYLRRLHGPSCYPLMHALMLQTCQMYDYKNKYFSPSLKFFCHIVSHHNNNNSSSSNSGVESRLEWCSLRSFAGAAWGAGWVGGSSPVGKWWSAWGLGPPGILWQPVDLFGALSGRGVTWVVRFSTNLLGLYWLRWVLSLKQEGNMPGTEIFSNSCAFLGSFS